MNKLQRAVDGQIIQFLSLPRIFNSLSSDLPSGSVKLGNGEIAYWRLHRNLSELKKQRKNLKDLAVKLAQAFKSLVNSDGFLNHYGLTKAPEIQTEAQLTTVFRNLLIVNTNKVDYSVVHFGNKNPLVETIIVSLGNMVFFNAYRGLKDLPKLSGIKGKLWLTESADTDQCFHFTVVSPVVSLTDYISPDRLANEVLNKIKQNLRVMAHNPRIEFNDGQFENYVGSGLQALTEKHAAAPNGANKKKAKNSSSALTTAPAEAKNEFKVLEKAEFDLLSDDEKVAYFDTIGNWINRTGGEQTDIVSKFLSSGVMKEEHAAYNAKPTTEVQVTLPYFLATLLGLTDAQFEAAMPEVMKYIVPAVAAVGGDEPVPAELGGLVTNGDEDLTIDASAGNDFTTQVSEDAAIGAASLG